MKVVLLVTAAWVALTTYTAYRDYRADEKLALWCQGFYRVPHPTRYQMPEWIEARHETVCWALGLPTHPVATPYEAPR